jgi:membrane protein DedA with SNARE-associated domain
MQPRRFLAWDAAAACISVPLVMSLGYVGGANLDRMGDAIATAHRYILLAVVVGVLGFIAWRQLRVRSAAS